MRYCYVVTDSTGAEHRADNRPALKAIFAAIRAKFGADAEFTIYAVTTGAPARESAVSNVC